MFRQLWQKWTIDKPAAFGDLLWEVLVVQLAALLDRLTLRRIIALTPVVFVILAYAHRIPIPPELMLVGDVLAYIDVVAVIALFSILGRVSALLMFAKQAADRALKLARRALVRLQRFDVRRERKGDTRGRHPIVRTKPDDEDPAFGFAWA